MDLTTIKVSCSAFAEHEGERTITAEGAEETSFWLACQACQVSVSGPLTPRWWENHFTLVPREE